MGGVDMAQGFVLIKTTPGMERAVVVDLLRNKITKNIHTVFGEFDIVIYMNTPDYQSLGQKVIEDIRIIPGVEDTMTLAGCTLKDLPYKG
ncbi:MAG: Lrp/AsnC family transcriptional regulator [Thermoplasmata archaeon]|nr:MAG: Lrp/AsnC family transcriptional regulator [Thermoplasmata archaeon]